MIGRQIKQGFNNTFAVFAFDGFAVCPLAKEETYCAQYDGFSGSGFTRNDRETFFKMDVQSID